MTTWSRRGCRPQRVLVNPNGVDVDELAPYREGDAIGVATARLACPTAPTVGFIGTFGRWHGVKLLPELIDAVPDAHWVLSVAAGCCSSVEAADGDDAGWRPRRR